MQEQLMHNNLYIKKLYFPTEAITYTKIQLFCENKTVNNK